MDENAHPDTSRVLRLLRGAERSERDPDVELAELLISHAQADEASITALLVNLVESEIPNPR